MKLKNIVTMDEELTFRNVEILNIKNEKQLDIFNTIINSLCIWRFI